MSNFLSNALKLYGNKSIGIIGLLGFFSGLPLHLTSGTLALWLNQEGIDIATIGLIGLTAIPYSFKFLWAPLVDRLRIPFLTAKLGLRRGWLFLSQLGIVVTLGTIALIDVHQQFDALILSCICLSFFAATQDIVMLTYQVERLGTHQYGAGEAMGIFGFRMGMLLAGAGALYMTAALSWQNIYAVMALISIFALMTTLLIEEPAFRKSKIALESEARALDYLKQHSQLPISFTNSLSWLYGAVICPFIDLSRRKGWILSLLIIFLYKSSDNMIGTMSNIFYIELGFSKIEIANASKVFGMIASIAGGFFGGALIGRFGMYKTLFYGGLIHALALFAFIILYKAGHDVSMLYWSVGIEHFTGGLRLTALFAYQMTLCSSSYAATQLALCASLVSFGRGLFSAMSGFLVEALGWQQFFILAILMSIPSLILIWFKKRYI